MDLVGLTILVLEDEPIIAMSLEDHLEEIGAVPLIAGSLQEAEEIIGERSIDAAILDINVHGRKSYPIADSLLELEIPFVFASGYGDTVHEGRFVDVPTVTKPYDIAAIRRVFEDADAPAPE